MDTKRETRTVSVDKMLQWAAERDALRAENERLRAALQAYVDGDVTQLECVAGQAHKPAHIERLAQARAALGSKAAT